MNEPEWDALFRIIADDRKFREMRRMWARDLAVQARRAQERRAREWDAYVKGAPVPPLTDAQVERIMRDIFLPPAE